MIDLDIPSENKERNKEGPILFNKIKEFMKPGLYNVQKALVYDTANEHVRIPLRFFMLKAMNVNEAEELNRQQDAMDCIRTLIEKIDHLGFLWHHVREQYKCNSCNEITSSDSDHPIALIPLSKIKSGKEKNIFSVNDNITEYFQSEEQMTKDCNKCKATTCTKKNILKDNSNYIVIQFKIYEFRLRSLRATKITAKSECSPVVAINTLQGNQNYKVIATIEHLGNDMKGGHYVSYILDNEDWYHCNNCEVNILPRNSKTPFENVYILLHKKL